jgi:hypothetical protein
MQLPETAQVLRSQMTGDRMKEPAKKFEELVVLLTAYFKAILNTEY